MYSFFVIEASQIKKCILFIFLLSFCTVVKAQIISCGSPFANFGLPITYCAEVKGSSFDSLGKKAGTILYLCIPYPNQSMTVVIKETGDERMFPYTLDQWVGMNICVTGTVNTYKGKYYIEVKKRTNLRVN